MVKKKQVLTAVIDPKIAMDTVAAMSKIERRDKRLELGRLPKLSDLDGGQANFFFGECMVFSQISEEIHTWIRENFYEKGGTPRNTARLRDLYQFYLALTSDVDIRYELDPAEDGEYEIKDPNIVANDFHIPKQFQGSEGSVH